MLCIGCGYDLRGLAVDAACPECGVPVRDTLTSFRALWSEEHKRQWEVGCRLIAWSAVTTGVVGSAIYLGWIGVEFGGLGVLGLYLALILVEHVLWLLGGLRLAQRHPGLDLMTTRQAKGIRVAVSINAGAALFIVGCLTSMWGGSSANEDVLIPVLLSLMLVALVSRINGIYLMGRLVGRTLSAAGAKARRIHHGIVASFALILCIAQIIATGFLLLATGANYDDWLIGIAALLGIGSFFALPVIGLWGAGAMFHAARAIRSLAVTPAEIDRPTDPPIGVGASDVVQ